MKTKLIEYCSLYEKGLLEGLETDKYVDKIEKILSTLSKVDRLNLLRPLCDHRSESVQLWAATYLLDVDEKTGISTIKEIISKESVIGLMAEAVYDMWKSDSLNLKVAD